MDIYNDPACDILSEEDFDGILSYYDRHHVYSGSGRRVVIARITSEFKIEKDIELILDLRGNGEEFAYRGPVSHDIIFYMPPEDSELGYSESSVQLILIDIKNRGICSWVNEGINIPNLQGGNRFLFKLVNPNDGTLSNFTIEHH